MKRPLTWLFAAFFSFCATVGLGAWHMANFAEHHGPGAVFPEFFGVVLVVAIPTVGCVLYAYVLDQRRGGGTPK